ncbi:MAG: ATP-grasp domain-containing protein [Treponema sp.]|jgi:biotin carboxylase|nr:ATP-grasp domain-containing protein [Treponema sp.]
MKNAIIILGAGVMQGPVIQIAKELGYHAVALDGSTEAPNINLADQFEKIDLKAKEEIESFARSLQNKFDTIGIMTAGTDFSASVAWVAEKLGLPGIPYETALNASDKGRMRECFKKAALPSPEFITVKKEDLDKLHSICPPFPFVIKPVDNMGSRGCRRIDSLEELKEAAETAIGFSRSGRAIIEAFMEGPEFSVDAIIYKGEITICGLADRHIFFPPYFIEMGHTMPTEISPDNQTAILDTFRSGIHALALADGNNIGAAKGDIKLTANDGAVKAMIGEIAARLSGGYMSGWTYPYASGVEPIRAAILMAMGQQPRGLAPVKNWTCAEKAFISIPGTVKEIIGVEQAQNQAHINNLFLRIEKGDKVDFPQNNVTKCGNIIASAEGRETAINAAETAAKSILIHLDPSDKSTEKFLAEKRGEEKHQFPPNAFDLTNEQKETLYGMASILEISGAIQEKLNLFPKDYMGRTIEENLKAVRQLAPKSTDNIVLGRSFWEAFIKGGYQGAVYYIESILGKNEKEACS